MVIDGDNVGIMMWEKAAAVIDSASEPWLGAVPAGARICIATKTALRWRPHSGVAIITMACCSLVSSCKVSQQAVQDFTCKGTSCCEPLLVTDSTITYEYSSANTAPAIDHIPDKLRYCGFIE